MSLKLSFQAQTQVLRSNGPILNALVKDYFAGDHITYKVSNCSLVRHIKVSICSKGICSATCFHIYFVQVFVPVHIDGYWSLYAWDFSSKRITIIDPVAKTIDLLHVKHECMITRLHQAMLSCKNAFFGCCSIDDQNWDRKYLTEKDHCCSMYYPVTHVF